MNFFSACISALLALVLVTAKLAGANRLEAGSEQTIIRNVDGDVEDYNKKDEAATPSHPTAESAYSSSGGHKEACSPPVTLSTTSKFDVGSLPWSSCSSSRQQICINNDMKQLSSGVCTDIIDVPISYWDTSDPSASSNIPASYWEETVSTTAARNERRLPLVTFSPGPPPPTDCGTLCSSGGQDASLFLSSFQDSISDCLSDTNCPYDTISCWNTTGITNMADAFLDQSDFDRSLDCWDTSQVTTVYLKVHLLSTNLLQIGIRQVLKK